VGSLLEVGTGFHPELTGRENIFLNGAILGMNKAEIQRKFDEIVDFSEVDKFIDTPVKHYSSGMYLRLAFAVAAHMEPEILIVDEVLAVGDAAFQKKCLGKMSEVAGEGRTVLFVSHNMGAIQNLCSKCVWLNGGELASIGDSGTVIREYLGGGTAEYGRFDGSGRVQKPSHAVIRKAWIERDGLPVGHLMFGDQVDLVLDIEVFDKIALAVELVLRQADGVPVSFTASGLIHDLDLDVEPGRLTVRAALPPVLLAIGAYSVDLSLVETEVAHFDRIESAIKFHVDSAVAGMRNWAFFQKWGLGHTLWDVKFEFHTAPVQDYAGEDPVCISAEREAKLDAEARSR
jgi:lipopolysaccharide transport system ATP-binding protein